MIHVSKCQLCQQRPAVWAMQYIAEDTPTFSLLGWHYRGFPISLPERTNGKSFENMFALADLGE